MQELMLMLAKVLPFEKVLTELKEAIDKYESNPDEDNKKHITFHCMLMASHTAMKDKNMDEVLTEATHMRKMSERFHDEKIGS